MKLYFLGTAASFPTPQRGVSSLGLQLDDGSVYLFDCGDGTQIQLHNIPIARRKITKIFITHLHGDHLFGLPGLICTISSHIGEKVSLPIIDICGPLGLRKFIYNTLSLSRSLLMLNFRIHELEPVECQYPEDWKDWIVEHSATEPLHPNEVPGRIIKPDHDENANVSWKIFNDDAMSVNAGLIHHRIPTFGFVIKEKDKPGTMLVDKLLSLGVKKGPLFGKLKCGQSVTLKDGREIDPRDVLGPDIVGRTIVICGDTSDASPMLHLVSDGCDVLVHEATHDDSLAEKAKEFGHSTPSQAAELSKRMGAKTLLLNHFSQRYSQEECVEILLSQAKKRLEGTEIEVQCTHDRFVYSLERSKREKT